MSRRHASGVAWAGLAAAVLASVAVLAALTPVAAARAAAAGTAPCDRFLLRTRPGAGFEGVTAVATPPRSLAATALPAGAFSAHRGRVPQQVEVRRLPPSRLSVGLVVDTAADLTADALRAEQAAAVEFALALPPATPVSVVETSRATRALVEPGTDRVAVVRALTALTASGSPAEAAAVATAARLTDSPESLAREVVLFSPGRAARRDEPGLEDARAALHRADAHLHRIGTGASAARSAGSLPGSCPSGPGVTLDEQSRRLAAALAGQYVLDVPVDSAAARRTVVQLRYRRVSATAPLLTGAAPAGVGGASSAGLVVAAVFAGLVLLFVVVIGGRLLPRLRPRAPSAAGTGAGTLPLPPPGHEEEQVASVPPPQPRPRTPTLRPGPVSAGAHKPGPTTPGRDPRTPADPRPTPASATDARRIQAALPASQPASQSLPRRWGRRHGRDSQAAVSLADLHEWFGSLSSPEEPPEVPDRQPGSSGG